MEINLRTLDLNLLRVAVAVWDTGSVSRAAEVVGMTQPATSNALTRLRVATGDTLFVKSKGGMVPTHYAQEVMPRVKAQLAALLETIAGETAFDPQQSSRVFRLSLSGLGEGVFLPPLLTDALTEAPNIRFETVPVPQDGLTRALETGKLDCAVGMIEATDTGLASRDLFTETYMVVAGSGVTAATPTLRTHKFALSFPPASFGNEMQELVARLGLTDRVAVRLASFTALGPLIENLPLLTIVPQQFADHLAHMQAIRILPIDLDEMDRHVRLVWHKARDADPENQWLRSKITALFAR